MKIIPIWSDSLGAKSFSFYIETDRHRIIIDPGIAIMQSSYPADKSLLTKWYKEGYERIKNYLSISDIVVITHYHYDHYLADKDDIRLYKEKMILIKDPNKYINDSQWKRAREFLQYYIEDILNEDVKRYIVEPQETDYHDYVEDYKISLSKDFGDYNERRKELLKKGKKWFLDRTEKWSRELWLKDVKSGENVIKYIDGKTVRLNDVKIIFSEPLYHGIEYSKTGWVIAVIIEYKNNKILFSSDIQGPTIEDYAKWIIDVDPNILLLDGPPTYLIPYMFNLINFRRTQENIKWIIRDTKNLELIIYDHHLTRDMRFRERTAEIYEYAKKHNIKILDVANYLGLKPAYEIAMEGKRQKS